ncbi:MAG: hypothetical protein J6T10_12090 [Methanobrevibacter sp.]|nr:hypothetical protein [Methanobrevibacter sp.]
MISKKQLKEFAKKHNLDVEEIGGGLILSLPKEYSYVTSEVSFSDDCELINYYDEGNEIDIWTTVQVTIKTKPKFEMYVEFDDSIKVHTINELEEHYNKMLKIIDSFRMNKKLVDSENKKLELEKEFE